MGKLLPQQLLLQLQQKKFRLVERDIIIPEILKKNPRQKLKLKQKLKPRMKMLDLEDIEDSVLINKTIYFYIILKI